MLRIRHVPHAEVIRFTSPMVVIKPAHFKINRPFLSSYAGFVEGKTVLPLFFATLLKFFFIVFGDGSVILITVDVPGGGVFLPI
jgi:hypothetical protein